MIYEEIEKRKKEVNGDMLKVRLGKRIIYVKGWISENTCSFSGLQVLKECGTIRYSKWGYEYWYDYLNYSQVIDVMPIKTYTGR